MTSPDAPLNLTPSHSNLLHDFEALAAKAVGELSHAEAEALAYWRSEVSKREYNPDTVAPADRSVETVDHGSTTLGALATDDSNPVLQQDAKDRIASVTPEAAAPVEAPAPAKASKASAPTAE